MTSETTTGTTVMTTTNPTTTDFTTGPTTQYSPSVSILGKVSNCTLSNAKQINVKNRTYCAADHSTFAEGYKTQSQALAHCKTLNARLPLPKSNAEAVAFFKVFATKTWIGITDTGTGSKLPSV